MVAQINKEHDRLHRLNRRISLVLQIMTAASLLLIIAGTLVYVLTGTPQSIEPMPLGTLISGMLTFSPAMLVTAGLIVALIMPLTVLAASLTHFIASRDRKPLIVCLMLLVIMAASFVFVLTVN